MASSSSQPNHLGSLLSFTTDAKIRYEGLFYGQNPHNPYLCFKYVKSYGTEGREEEGQHVPPSDKIYEYLLVRGTKVKESYATASPLGGIDDPIYNDPAIIQVEGGSEGILALLRGFIKAEVETDVQKDSLRGVGFIKDEDETEWQIDSLRGVGFIKAEDETDVQIHSPQKLFEDSIEAGRRKLEENIEKLEGKISKIEKTIFQLANYYFVFQGVILTAVVTGSSLSSGGFMCHHKWLPISLSIIGFLLNITPLSMTAWKYKESLDELAQRKLALGKYLGPEICKTMLKYHKIKKIMRKFGVAIFLILFGAFLILNGVGFKVVLCQKKN